MSRSKTRVSNTDINNLVSNLRGEIGEIISSWVLMWNFRSQARLLQTDDVVRDMNDDNLKIIYIMIEKLEDEIVARLSELAEERIGTLTFYFVQEKLCLFKREVVEFARFIRLGRFHEKRNYSISHKELPEKWTQHKYLYIPYRTVVKAIVLALRLMKKIDRSVLGPSAPFLWREMRKRRYVPFAPAKTSYMLLPYLGLSAEERTKIAFLEAGESEDVWVKMKVTVNGSAAVVWACKKWGVLRLGNSIIAVSQYPIIEIKGIETKKPSIPPDSGEDALKRKKSEKKDFSVPMNS